MSSLIFFSDFLVASMVRKFESLPAEPNIEAFVSDELIEKYKTKIQNFITDYRLLVKRNPNNWVH